MSRILTKEFGNTFYTNLISFESKRLKFCRGSFGSHGSESYVPRSLECRDSKVHKATRCNQPRFMLHCFPKVTHGSVCTVKKHCIKHYKILQMLLRCISTIQHCMSTWPICECPSEWDALPLRCKGTLEHSKMKTVFRT